jgi:hypothetical protein
MTGDHAPDGALLVAGDSVAPGRIPPASLVDVAPLALTALGVATPPWMDGRVPQGTLSMPGVRSQASAA